MSGDRFSEWERRTVERARPALMACKWLGAVMLTLWAVSLVWASERTRQRVACIYNAETVEAWDSCSKVTKLESLVRALNGALIDF